MALVDSDLASQFELEDNNRVAALSSSINSRLITRKIQGSQHGVNR